MNEDLKGGEFAGAKFRFLAANVHDTATGTTVFPGYGVKSFLGNKVAFIGMTLEGTPTIVSPSGVAGLQFNDEADTVNALVPKLKRRRDRNHRRADPRGRLRFGRHQWLHRRVRSHRRHRQPPRSQRSIWSCQGTRMLRTTA
jgi:hypothetical protein